MSYDSAGNLNFDDSDGIGGTRTYDAENRMKQAWANNQWQTYTYDGDGHLVKRSVNVTETWQVYGLAGELIAEDASLAQIHWLVTDQTSENLFVAFNNRESYRYAGCLAV